MRSTMWNIIHLKCQEVWRVELPNSMNLEILKMNLSIVFLKLAPSWYPPSLNARIPLNVHDGGQLILGSKLRRFLAKTLHFLELLHNKSLLMVRQWTVDIGGSWSSLWPLGKNKHEHRSETKLQTTEIQLEATKVLRKQLSLWSPAQIHMLSDQLGTRHCLVWGGRPSQVGCSRCWYHSGPLQLGAAAVPLLWGHSGNACVHFLARHGTMKF